MNGPSSRCRRAGWWPATERSRRFLSVRIKLRATSTNLALCDPMCLDASSPDNTTGFKGAPSPLWTLVGLKDPTLGTETCGGTVGGECNHDLPAPAPTGCLGKITVLSLQYAGGGCAAMDNSQAKDKVKCTQFVNN